MRLSKRAIAIHHAVDKPTLIFDTQMKGFGLRLMPPSTRNPKGTRSWFVEYRLTPGGENAAKRRVSLGSMTSLTLEQARDAAAKHLADAAVRQHPVPVDAANQDLRSVAQLSLLYREEADPIRKARTVQLYEGYWRNHILPVLGKRSLSEIQRHDIVRLHRGLGRTNRTTANRVLGLLSHFYHWAALSCHVPSGYNPCLSIDKFKEGRRERYLTDEELARFGAALARAETQGISWAREASGELSKHAPKCAEHRRTKIDPDAADAIRVLLFTGARLREVLHLKWSDYDRQRCLVLLPDSKTGRKTVVLGQHAAAALESTWKRAMKAAAKLKGGERPISAYVFPSHDPHLPRADLKRPWAMLVREANLPGLRIHDLRHSFASIGVSAQLGLPIIGGLLGHSSTQTTERYAHLAAAPLRTASDLISANIQAALMSRCNGVTDNFARPTANKLAGFNQSFRIDGAELPRRAVND
jgi:integrase